MKKLRIDAIIFILIIFALLFANLFNFEKDTVSQLENRMLKTKPEFSTKELFNGGFFRGYEDYYSDTFIKRDNMVRASRDLKAAISLNEPGVTLVVSREKDEAINEEKPDATTKPPATPQPPAIPQPPVTNPPVESQQPIESNGPKVSATPTPTATPTATPTPTPTPGPPKDFGDEETVGYYLIIDGKAVQLFKFNRGGMDYYAEVINKYQEKLGDDVTIYSLIPPTASEFVKLRRYSDITDSQNDAMDYLYSKLHEGIVTVNVYDELNRNKDEYIYYKTDHHWTSLGAYYGYRAFMDAIGEQAVPIERYETAKVENYLGSTYTKTLNKDLEKNPDTIELYLPFTEYEYTMHTGNNTRVADLLDMSYAQEGKDKYLIFMSTGGATWSVIKTDVNNGKKIMVMKDSFGNAWVQYLLPHYEEIYVVDARFYSKYTTGLTIPEFIEEYEIQELVFLFYMEDVNWSKFMNGVEGHLE